MFVVKNFSPLAQVAKNLRAKICLRRIIRVTLPAVAKIKHAEIYHVKKNERENFPIYGITVVSYNSSDDMHRREKFFVLKAYEELSSIYNV